MINDLQPRNAAEIAERTLVLVAISSAAHERPPISVRSWLEKSNLLKNLSKWERRFISDDMPSNGDLALASWRIEACAPLLWCLNRLEAISDPIAQTTRGELGVDNEVLIAPDEFIRKATVRSKADLWRMQANLEMQHWGIRAGAAGRATFGGGDSKGEFDLDIVYQRHYAINWVVGLADDWDNVVTDT